MFDSETIRNGLSGQGVKGKTDAFFLTSTDRKILLIALLSLFAVRLLAIFWVPFVDTTEARYVEIARKMLETGDWITPQFDYDIPFWGKPPLHTWLSALGMKVFGEGAFGARVLIFATSLGVVGLVFNWVQQHRGKDQALVACVILCSSVLFFGASAFVMTDMAMVLGTTLSMVGFYNCICTQSNRTFWGRMFFVGIAIGLLAKGPVALVITTIPLILWLTIGGRWRMLFQLPWGSGLLIASLITVPWYAAAEIKTPGFLQYFLIGEHFQRFVFSGWDGDLYGSGHARPKGTIWLYALGTFLPWTFFACALLPRVKLIRDRISNDDAGWHSYLALWVISPLLLFAPAANILPAYVLPGIPAAAVLLVTFWASAFGPPSRLVKGAVALSLTIVGAVFLLISSLSYWQPATLNLKTARELVVAGKSVDPDISFTYWGKRSYSAEFYTQGQVRFTTIKADIDALVDNEMRDAVAISSNEAMKLGPTLEDNFEPMGLFRDRILFIERNVQEESQ